jgi:hypothetical protein
MIKKIYTGLVVVAVVAVASIIISRIFESDEPEEDSS